MQKSIALRPRSRVKKILIHISIMLYCIYSVEVFANSTRKAMWYRYIDERGIANISSSVSPDHIRHGYDSLDRNMQVIQKIRPFHSEKTPTQHRKEQKSATYTQKESDQRLKQAYGSSRLAIQKRQESLNHIEKQIRLQQSQLEQWLTDRLMFKRQEQTYVNNHQPIPLPLQKNLAQNKKNIQIGRTQLQSLQSLYRKNQVEYDTIILRLKALE